KTIIFSTHILPEVATIADRILVINKGEIVGDGTFEELRESVTRYNTLVLGVKGKKCDIEKSLKNIKVVQDVKVEQKTGTDEIRYKIFYESGADILEDINAILRERKLDVVTLHHEKLSLEDSFIRLTGEDKEASREGGVK
ncbi:hypothetical protein DRQ07_00090, partial [candidate division KSB1 bacterium]